MKCNKVKKSCKICFQSVSKKNGLQCQGACQKWAHFKCLNYTPGKIQDIKTGVIKVTCPCPDCSTSGIKEILTDPPFTCTNAQCPANKAASCGSNECPSKAKNPIPTYPLSPLECSPVASFQRPPCSSSPKCTSPAAQVPPSPPFIERNCTSAYPPVCLPSCPSWQKVKKAKPCSPKQSQSCSNLSNESFSGGKPLDKMRKISSDSKLPNAGVNQKMLFGAIENLCNTVGQLSNQLRDLMCKMKAGYGK